MPFNSQIDRSGSGALIPEDASRDIIQMATEQSAVLRLARRLPNMTRAQRRIPVLATLPQAYFVQGDTGLKQTSSVSWENVYINAEELAVIVPIPDSVRDDVDYDIWGEIRPLISQAIGKAIDQAILYGNNAPNDWPDDLLTGATSAGNTVTLNAGSTDIYDNILGAGGVIAAVEEDGFFVNGHVAAMSLRAKLRGLRDDEGRPIFLQNMQDNTRYLLDGQPIEFPRNGAIDPAQSLLFSGDWDQLVYAVRQELTWKMLDQAVLTDQAGNIIVNLAQQDMTALRVVMRLGWQLPNPLNNINGNDATRYPFAVLLP